MRRRLILAFAAAAAAVCAVAGCSTQAAEQPPPTPTTVTASASTEDLEARTVWAAYLQTFGDLLADRSADTNRMKPYVTAAHLEAVKSNVADFRGGDLRLEGRIATKAFVPQDAGANNVLEALVCTDYSATRLFDASDREVTPQDREVLVTVKVTFVERDGMLVVDKDANWDSSSVC